MQLTQKNNQGLNGGSSVSEIFDRFPNPSHSPGQSPVSRRKASPSSGTESRQSTQSDIQSFPIEKMPLHIEALEGKKKAWDEMISKAAEDNLASYTPQKNIAVKIMEGFKPAWIQ